MAESTGQLPSFVDERGTLLPIELSGIAFPVQRVFVVKGTTPPQSRGNHIVSCDELIVLISGTVAVRVGPGPDDLDDAVVLDTLGQSIPIATGSFIVYELGDDRSAILVLAAEPYQARTEEV